MAFATLTGWIQSQAIPFSTDSADSFNSAVDRFAAALDPSAELVGFGEALHGGEDILSLRNRLFGRLVEAHGFSAIAVESSLPRTRLLNDYVCGKGQGSLEAVADAGLSHGFGRLEANRELVEWMRRYNLDPSHRTKIRFYGFDSPTEMTGTDSPRQVLSFALSYFASIDRSGGEERQRRIEALLGPDSDWENPAAMMDPSKSVGLSPSAVGLRGETEDLISELQVRRPELAAKSGEDRYEEALHHAIIARQLLGYHAELAKSSEDRIARLLGIRDAMMAGNLLHILSRERGRGRVFAFAHNRHLQRGRVEWRLGTDVNVWWPAGSHLALMLYQRYVVIGSGLGVSEANGIGSPEPGTLEAALTRMPEQALLIPTDKGEGLPASDIEALPTRSASAKNRSYFPLTPESFTDFDWLCVLKSSVYARGGPALPQRPGA